MGDTSIDSLTTEDRAVLAQSSGMLTIFEDPISFEIMDKAMMTPCGHSFSEDTIMGWLQTHKHCPLCNKTLSKTEVLPNYALRTAIGRFLTAQRRLHANLQHGSTSLSECYTPPASTELNMDDWKTIRIEESFDGEIPMTDSKLLVEVISARDLKTDWFGNTDPYCVLEFQDQKKRTKVMHKNRSPKWEETFVFNVMNIHSEGSLVLTLYDRDRILKDSFLGMVLIPLPEVVTAVKVVRRFPLQKKRPSSRKKIRGDIFLRLQFLDLRKSYEAGRTERKISSITLSTQPSTLLSPPPLMPNIPLNINRENNIGNNSNNNRQVLPPPPLPPRHNSVWVRGDLHPEDAPPPLPNPIPLPMDDLPPLPPPDQPLEQQNIEQPLQNEEQHLQILQEEEREEGEEGEEIPLDNTNNSIQDGVHIQLEGEELEEGELIDLRIRSQNVNLLVENSNNDDNNNNNNNNDDDNDEMNNIELNDDDDQSSNDVNKFDDDQQEKNESFRTQMNEFDQIQNVLSDIIHEAREVDEESKEDMYSEKNNEDDDNIASSSHSRIREENEEDDDEEEELRRSRRSHFPDFVEVVDHPLSEPARDAPPVTLTSLVQGRSATPPPSYMNVVVEEQNVLALMDMGFQRNLAELALKTCNNDFDAALDRLLNKPEELQLEILKSMFFYSL